MHGYQLGLFINSDVLCFLAFLLVSSFGVGVYFVVDEVCVQMRLRELLFFFFFFLIGQVAADVVTNFRGHRSTGIQ